VVRQKSGPTPVAEVPARESDQCAKSGSRSAWLRGPLRGWADDLLAPSRLGAQGFVDPVAVRACWDAHQAGRPGLEYPLWAVLVFEAWLEEAGATS